MPPWRISATDFRASWLDRGESGKNRLKSSRNERTQLAALECLRKLLETECRQPASGRSEVTLKVVYENTALRQEVEALLEAGHDRASVKTTIGGKLFESLMNGQSQKGFASPDGREESEDAENERGDAHAK